MYKRIITGFTLFCFIMCIGGCAQYTTHMVSREDWEQHDYDVSFKIINVVTVDGEVLEFVPNASLKNNYVEGYLNTGRFVKLPIDQVEMMYIERYDPMKSTATTIAIGVLAVAALLGVGFLIVMATKESCPFVYSFNGDRYVFDGEPYGGSICEDLKRTDLCLLEYLRPINGEYRLLLTNEVNETQYTDEFKLWIIDHPVYVEVIQDAQNNLHTVNERVAPVMVEDSHGGDLMKYLSDKDLLLWESDLARIELQDVTRLHDTLLLSFIKPEHAEIGKLIVHGCNTLWASQMLRKVAELYGGDIEQWFDYLKSTDDPTERFAWFETAQTYVLSVCLWEDNAWVKRGKIIGGGPFMAEERIVLLDLKGVKGNTVKIQLTPPRGFWRLNSFAMDYSQNVSFDFKEISATSVMSDDNRDIGKTLDSSDAEYHVMPETGQFATLTFPAPLLRNDCKRTIFAKVSGYYRMHIESKDSPQPERLKQISSEADGIVKFALEEYEKWCNGLSSIKNDK